MTFVNSILFSVLLTMFLVYHDSKQKIKIDVHVIDAPKYSFTHRNLPESEKYIWIFKNVHESLDSFILASRDNWSRATRHSAVSAFTENSRVSWAQPRINAYEILLQHDWLLFFSRHNRFAETHSHLQLWYHITDRLLTAGNQWNILGCTYIFVKESHIQNDAFLATVRNNLFSNKSMRCKINIIHQFSGFNVNMR